MSESKRFGGPHSPGGRSSSRGETQGGWTPPPPTPPKKTWFSGRKTRSFSWRVLGLYLAPTPLLVSGLGALMTADLPRIAWAGGGWAALIFAARLTGDGIKAAAAFEERVIARPPAFPRKLFAAALTGLSIAGVAFLGIRLGIIESVFYGLFAAGAHVLTFGPDPMRAKGMAGVNAAELDQVASKLEAAEEVVKETVAAAKGLRERKLTDRIDRLAFAARDILREIESDPRDLGRSRRFLSVHLVGLRDATMKFAAVAAKGASEGNRQEYELLLSDLEQSFSNHRRKLMAGDQTELEVEIEVLRDRLKQEGAISRS